MTDDVCVRVLAQRVANPAVQAPAGAKQLNTAAERDLLDLFHQSAWAGRYKSWFSARAARRGPDNFISEVIGWLDGLDGQPQFLRRHPDAGPTDQRVRRLATSDGMAGMGNIYPVTSPTVSGTLLSSANALLPPAELGVSSLTVAFLAHQPTGSGGFILSADDMGSGTNQMTVGWAGSPAVYSAYSRRSPAAVATTADQAAGALELVVIEFDGGTHPNIWRNGVLQSLAGTPSCGPVLGGQRFRWGSLRGAAGASFTQSFDGYGEEIWLAPDISSDIRAALGAYTLEKHPSLDIAA